MMLNQVNLGRLVTMVVVAGCLLSLDIAHASPEKVLYTFKGDKDGANPAAGLIIDAAGDFYGTTENGGSERHDGLGCGTAFKLTPDGTETILHAFECHRDGMNPGGALVMDGKGNLFGTTEEGGKKSAEYCGFGCGTVYRIAADGKERVLYSLRFRIGVGPSSALILDKHGNLYGTAEVGGYGCISGGCGTVFKVTPGGRGKLLYDFRGDEDGGYPLGGVVRDDKGNLYGTTSSGGSQNLGTVYQLNSRGIKKTLHSFVGGTDGAYPSAGLVMDVAGTFYGTTSAGGGGGCRGGGCGTVFIIAPDGTESVVYAFQGGNDGATPVSGLVLDESGNLYGTTPNGGNANCSMGCGTVFEVTPLRKELILYAFTGGSDGYYPHDGVLADGVGDLYGTTAGGGGECGCGVVFEIKK